MQGSFGKTVLPNGVRVLTEGIPGMRSVSLGIWVDAGSRDESPSESGISHFVEHMVFKGTERFSALDIAKMFDRMGGFSNAFTSKETTCFHVKVVDSHLDDALHLLAEIFLRSSFDPDESEREKQVILQEISMVQDTPEDLVHDIHCGAYWPDHGLGRPVLGSPETLLALTRERLKGFVAASYVGPRIMLCAAGRIDHDAFADKALRIFGGSGSADGGFSREKPGGRPGVTIVSKQMEQTHMILGFGGPSHGDDRTYAASLLNVVLGGSMSSRLFQEVRERRGLAYSVYSFQASYQDTGTVGMYAALSPERVGEAMEVMLAEFVKLADKPLPDDELAAAKDYLKGGILLSAESIDTRMTHLAKSELHHGRMVSFEEVVEHIQNVTAGDVMRVARSAIDEGASLTILGPVGGSEDRYRGIFERNFR